MQFTTFTKSFSLSKKAGTVSVQTRRSYEATRCENQVSESDFMFNSRKKMRTLRAWVCGEACILKVVIQAVKAEFTVYRPIRLNSIP